MSEDLEALARRIDRAEQDLRTIARAVDDVIGEIGPTPHVARLIAIRDKLRRLK